MLSQISFLILPFGMFYAIQKFHSKIVKQLTSCLSFQIEVSMRKCFAQHTLIEGCKSVQEVMENGKGNNHL